MRSRVEWAARAVAFALVAFAGWRLIASLGASDEPRVHAVLDGDVTAHTRDSLAALAHAGARVTWSGDISAVAAMAEPVREPAAGWRLSVVSNAPSAVRDSLGPLDSLGAGGGALSASGVRGALAVSEGATTARTRGTVDASLGRVLVLARAGWEAKFTIAALEEAGWRVDARLAIAPGVVVSQGSDAATGAREARITSSAPTLARHAAVVVLDTAVGRDAAAIRRYVRAGGGLVLAGEGANAPSLRSVAPARVTRVLAPESRTFYGPEPLHSLPLHALGGLRDNAVTLETRDGALATVAWRVGAGRVVQMGHAETWRWRMQGEGEGVAQHRAYWSRLVGSVAAAEYTPVGEAPDDVESPPVSGPRGHTSANAAPLALTVQALGAPSEPPSRAPRDPDAPVLPPWLAPLILALLLAEWASRRARGAP